MMIVVPDAVVAAVVAASIGTSKWIGDIPGEVRFAVGGEAVLRSWPES